MRDTDYATELVPPAIIKYEGGHEARLERIRVKESDEVEIRLSWWKNGNIVPRPLDLPEKDFMKLIAKGILQEVLFADEDVHSSL